MSAPRQEPLDALRGRPIVALSPHPDDVAFSIGGLVRHLARDSSVTVATVFTRHVWAPNLDPDARDPDRVSRIREQEDARYCARIGAARVALGFDDAGLRGYDDETERLGLRPDDTIGPIVRTALDDLLSPGSAVLCPLGLGGHVDHLVVRDAARTIARSGGLELWFYEDLPYARSLPGRTIERHALEVDPAIEGVRFPLTPSAWARKVEDVSAYRTQLRDVDLDDLTAHARRTGDGPGLAERIWRGAATPPSR